jgi:hypothetical protein
VPGMGQRPANAGATAGDENGVAAGFHRKAPEGKKGGEEQAPFVNPMLPDGKKAPFRAILTRWIVTLRPTRASAPSSTT